MAKAMTYDEFGRTRPLDVFATCRRCKRPIRYGQPIRAIRRRAGGHPVGWTHQLCLVVAA